MRDVDPRHISVTNVQASAKEGNCPRCMVPEYSLPLDAQWERVRGVEWVLHVGRMPPHEGPRSVSVNYDRGVQYPHK